MMTLDATGGLEITVTKALASLHPTLLAALNHRDVRIAPALPSQNFGEVVRHPKARELERADLYRTIAGAYAKEIDVLVLRPVSPGSINEPDVLAVLTHEAAHVLDVVRGDGKYASKTDPVIRDAYQRAKTSGLAVSDYALKAPHEMVAETIRELLVGDADFARTLDTELCNHLERWFAMPIGDAI